jgi:hypothetical protein
MAPAGADWLHEIRHDGFRLMVRRDGDRVRLFTRNGHDWAVRYPAIAAAAVALQARSFLIDGEVVVADAQGIASFDLLRGRARETQAFVWAFDLLELDGKDLRNLPLERRKGELKIQARVVRVGAQRLRGRRRAGALRSGLCHGVGGHRLEAPELPLPVGPLAALAQGEEPGERGGAARGVRGLGQEALAVS